jgi:imidazolonepropionase-like amidohydrolase
MKRLLATSLVAAATALAACAGVPPAVPAATATAEFAIVDVTVIDPRDGRRIPRQVVLIEGGRVAAVGDVGAVAVPAGAERVDGRTRFLLPGLHDMQVHALWDPVVRDTFLPALLAHGVTGVRDMGGTLDVLAQVRAEQQAQWRPWPAITASGPVLDGPAPVDPSISIAVASAADATAAVDRLAAAGVDFVKVYTLLAPDAYRAAVAAARRHGLPVDGHVPHGVAVTEAATGMRAIEHLRAETGGLCAGLSTGECADAYEALREHGVWQTPTLLPRHARAHLDDPARAAPDAFRAVPCVLREAWAGNRERRLATLESSDHDARRAEYARESADAAALPSRGLRLLAGSDAGADFARPGIGLHDELALLVDAGLTPLQALQAATTAPAAFLGRDADGWIGAGRSADLLLLDADPLLDIRNTRRIAGVVRAGRWLDRDALDALLRAADAASACPSPP